MNLQCISLQLHSAAPVPGGLLDNEKRSPVQEEIMRRRESMLPEPLQLLKGEEVCV